MANASRRQQAEEILMLMVAAQGDNDSWNKQKSILMQRLKQ